MKKLLHERLMDIHSIAELNDSLGIPIKDQFIATIQALADEIERYYIPRPRFENGEPVQFGDKALRWDGKHGNDGENVVSITIEGGDYLRYGFNGDICSSQPFKRPQPKVLDADGVEIKVGDTVWDVKFPSLHGKVAAVQPDFKDCEVFVIWDDEAETHTSYKELTHKEPVLDADGVPIKVGDMVWYVNGGNMMKVVGFLDDGNLSVDIDVGLIEPLNSHWYKPSDVTHKEPDSLEKLYDDMLRYADISMVKFVEDDVRRWADRLYALIERGA